MMVVWLKRVQREDTGVKLRTFIDDVGRCGCANAGGRPEPSKGPWLRAPLQTRHWASFCTRKSWKVLAQLRKSDPDLSLQIAGNPVQHLACGTRCYRGPRAKLAGEVQATSRGLRCALLRKLVVLLFRWAAPWFRFPNSFWPLGRAPWLSAWTCFLSTCVLRRPSCASIAGFTCSDTARRPPARLPLSRQRSGSEELVTSGPRGMAVGTDFERCRPPSSASPCPRPASWCWRTRRLRRRVASLAVGAHVEGYTIRGSWLVLLPMLDT